MLQSKTSILSLLGPQDVSNFKLVSRAASQAAEEFRGDRAMMQRYCAFLDTPLYDGGITIEKPTHGGPYGLVQSVSSKTYVTYRAYLLDVFRGEIPDTTDKVLDWDDDYKAKKRLAYMILYGLVPGFAVRSMDTTIFPFKGWDNDGLDWFSNMFDTEEEPWLTDVFEYLEAYSKYSARIGDYTILLDSYQDRYGNHQIRVQNLLKEAERKLRIVGFDNKFCPPGRAPLTPLYTSEYLADPYIVDSIKATEIPRLQALITRNNGEALYAEWIERKTYATNPTRYFATKQIEEANATRIKEIEATEQISEIQFDKWLLKQYTYFVERHTSLESLRSFKARERRMREQREQAASSAAALAASQGGIGRGGASN